MRRRALLAAAVLVVALPPPAGAATTPTGKAYLARVSSVCVSYARRLERIPTPSEAAASGNVISSLRRALPLLRAQERAMRAIPPPPALSLAVRLVFALDRSSIDALARALKAAERGDTGSVVTEIARFGHDRDQVHETAVRLGIRCNLN